jgi:hypothetical protein
MSYSKDQRGGLQSIVRKKLRLSVSQVTRNKILTTVSKEETEAFCLTGDKKQNPDNSELRSRSIPSQVLS